MTKRMSAAEASLMKVEEIRSRYDFLAKMGGKLFWEGEATFPRLTHIEHPSSVIEYEGNHGKEPKVRTKYASGRVDFFKGEAGSERRTTVRLKKRSFLFWANVVQILLHRIFHRLVRSG